MQMNDVKAHIEKLIAELNIPYFEIIVSKGHEEVYHQTIKRPEDAGKNRLYMYSCTKPLTATVALRLIQEGKMSLEDKVADYIPEANDAYVLNEDGSRNVVGHTMTIRHLLTMSAGFNYNRGTPWIKELLKDGYEPTSLELTKAYFKAPLDFVPGARFQYSVCHDVLGTIIELITGMRLSEYIKQIITEPLGMKDSGFAVPPEEVTLPLYDPTDDGYVEVPLSQAMVFPKKRFDSGGSGLVSTMEDYAKFARALANDGTGPDGYSMLSAESVKALRNEEISSGNVQNKFTCVQGADYSYGLGVRTRTRETEWGLGVGEFGWDGMSGSYLMVDPNTHISIVMGLHIRSWPRYFKGRHMEIVELIYRAMGVK